MRYLQFLLIVCTLFANTFSKENKEYSVYRIDDKDITLDGKLDEPIWGITPQMEKFVLHNTGQSGEIETICQMVWSDEYLYLAFRTTDPDMYSKYTNQDDDIYKRDDLVEFFFDPNGTGKNYGEIGISVSNVNYDFIIINPDPNNWQSNTIWDVDGLKSNVDRNGTINSDIDKDSSWTIEIKIPFISLTGIEGVNLPIKIGDSWRGNVYRIDHDHNTVEWKPNGMYSWNETGEGGFHTPSRFGTFVFKDKLTTIHAIPKSTARKIAFENRNGAYRIYGENVESVSLYTVSGKMIFFGKKNRDVLPVLSKGMYLLVVKVHGVKMFRRITID